MIEVFGEKGKEIKQSFIPQLPLEIAVVRITQKVFCQKPDAFVFAAKDVVPAVQIKTAAATGSSIKFDATKTEIEIKPERVGIEKVAESVENQPVAITDNNKIITITEIIENWQAIIQKLIASNFSLASLLKISQPLKIDKQFLEIAVTSVFYKGRLEANNNRVIIETAITEIIGSPIVIKGVVADNVAPIEVNFEFNDPADDVTASDATIPEANNLINEVKNAVATSPKLDVADEVLSMF